MHRTRDVAQMQILHILAAELADPAVSPAAAQQDQSIMRAAVEVLLLVNEPSLNCYITVVVSSHSSHYSGPKICVTTKHNAACHASCIC
jgi:hypothetical protein